MKTKILVVDDEAPIRELLSTYLKKYGYDIIVAANGKEAQRLTDEESLHLVIMDIVLPDADGMEVLSAVRQNHPNLPVIMLTGIGFDEELLQEAQQRGAAGYISKTLPLDQLLMEVRRVLSYKPAKPAG
jgi:DNA-binding response OmpR family regulator